MLIFFVGGGPVTGCTTTTNDIVDYFSDYCPDCRVQVVGKNAQNRYDSGAGSLKVYRSIVENSDDVIIFDGVIMNYFDRKLIIDTVNDAKRVNPDVDVKFIAIHHNRSERFEITHNEDEGHKPYTLNRMREIISQVQQPLKREGIDMIHNVRHDKYINIKAMVTLANRLMNLDLPVPEDVEAEADDGNKEEVKDE